MYMLFVKEKCEYTLLLKAELLYGYNKRMIAT